MVAPLVHPSAHPAELNTVAHSPLQASTQDKDESESESEDPEAELPLWRAYKECITCRNLHKSVAVRNWS